jgi:hypothetical protein
VGNKGNSGKKPPAGKRICGICGGAKKIRNDNAPGGYETCTWCNGSGWERG